MKRLYRSHDNRIIAGVLGGFGEYFKIDPVLLRVIFIFLVLATGIIPGVLAYFIATLIIPKKRTSHHGGTVHEGEVVSE